MKTLLVTGGAGFIGTNFIRRAMAQRPDWRLVNLDVLTYAGNPANLQDLGERHADRYRFVMGDIGDEALVGRLLADEAVSAVVHFAAESHVDRSIHGPMAFVQTNVVGTCHLLRACHDYWRQSGNDRFRFVHVSTDEVFGSLGPEGHFTEQTAYDPSSPYSASKAAADHFVRAWHRTFDLPVLVTNCSNNYGPYQFPEKLIPLMITRMVAGQELPVYGDGQNVRDWLYVIDHCDALIRVLEKGTIGRTYAIGGGAERSNIDVVRQLCDLVDQRLQRSSKDSSRHLVRFVTDRPGHDRRYAIDAARIRSELGWQPQFTFEAALEQTVDWYLENEQWVDFVRSGAYRQWVAENYGRR